MTGGLHRRHVPQGQERLVLDDLPAAAGAADLRPDAVRCSSPTRTASRASAAPRTATTSTRAPPTWPTCTTPTATGAATGKLLRRRVPGPRARLLHVPDDPALASRRMALYMAVSIACFAMLDAFVKVSRTRSRRSSARSRSASSTGSRAAIARPRARSTWALRAAAIALAARLARAHLPQGEAVPRAAAPGRAAAAGARPVVARRRSLARRRAARAGAPEVTFVPDNKRVAPSPGMTLLEIAEANGMTIEAGCRMGVCGADPVAIKDGMECTVARSPTTSGRRSSASARRRTRAWRAACASRARSSVALTPDKAERAALSRILELQLRQGGRARRRARQRDRRRHRRRPRAPAPPGRRDRPRRRGAAPPLQPHGHRPPRLRPLARCRASTSTRTPGTTSARSRRG